RPVPEPTPRPAARNDAVAGPRLRSRLQTGRNPGDPHSTLAELGQVSGWHVEGRGGHRWRRWLRRRRLRRRWLRWRWLSGWRLDWWWLRRRRLRRRGLNRRWLNRRWLRRGPLRRRELVGRRPVGLEVDCP